MNQPDESEARFISREITAWGDLALMRRMLQIIWFSASAGLLPLKLLLFWFEA